MSGHENTQDFKLSLCVCVGVYIGACGRVCVCYICVGSSVCMCVKVHTFLLNGSGYISINFFQLNLSV